MKTHLKRVLVTLAMIASTTGQTSELAVAEKPTLPMIDLWYGDHQSFGPAGNPQPLINVLGSVDPVEQVADATFRVNKGRSRPVVFGPDLHRLARRGDFNLEIDRSTLKDGENAVEIRLRTPKGRDVFKELVIDFQENAELALPLEIDFSKVDRLQDVVEATDGKWNLTGEGVRTAEPYYDRQLTFGAPTLERCRTSCRDHFSSPLCRLRRPQPARASLPFPCSHQFQFALERSPRRWLSTAAGLDEFGCPDCCAIRSRAHRSRAPIGGCTLDVGSAASRRSDPLSTRNNVFTLRREIVFTIACEPKPFPRRTLAIRPDFGRTARRNPPIGKCRQSIVRKLSRQVPLSSWSTIPTSRFAGCVSSRLIPIEMLIHDSAKIIQNMNSLSRRRSSFLIGLPLGLLSGEVGAVPLP